MLTDCSELTITQQQPLLSDSVLLKINEKRQEQLKSIHAYRQQQQNLNIALLSEIANEFYKKITIATTMSKDGIEHHDVFTGKEAVVKYYYYYYYYQATVVIELYVGLHPVYTSIDR